MQSSFAARVSQLISVVRASADIESDTTWNAIKHLVPSMFWLLRNDVKYPPVAESKQRSIAAIGNRQSCVYVLLGKDLGRWNGNRPTGSRCLTVDNNEPIG